MSSIEKTAGRFRVSTTLHGCNWIEVEDSDHRGTKLHGLSPEDARDLMYALKRTLKTLKRLKKEWNRRNPGT